MFLHHRLVSDQKHDLSGEIHVKHLGAKHQKEEKSLSVQESKELGKLLKQEHKDGDWEHVIRALSIPKWCTSEEKKKISTHCYAFSIYGL